MTLDPHRPRFHLVADGWMNDPKPFYWNGEYHLFFQHVPGDPKPGAMCWGHAVSRDLLRWEMLPVALSPTPGSIDAAGCWTGSVIRGPKQFHLFYTAISQFAPLRQTQAVATSDDLVHWTKSPQPVIAEPPPGFGECFRDPQVWREGDAYYMLIGSEQPGGAGGAALLYRSDDLASWRYLHPLFLGTPATGFDFECPDFFPLGDRHVFLSSRGLNYWQTGRYADHRFTPQMTGVVDGGRYYAGKTTLDDRGRRLLFGWIREPRTTAQVRAGGWCGTQALARSLEIRPDGSLGMQPVDELKSLRRSHHHIGPAAFGTLGDGVALLPLEGIRGESLDIELKMFCGTASRVGLLLRASPDLRISTPALLRVNEGMLGDAPLRLGAEEALELRVVVDRSVIEVCANGRAALTLRTYPPEGCDRIALFAQGGEARLISCDAWTLE
ncbi:MAG: glycoside hydrolase family 32 protein [Phycisphaeraceae bacterium]|nr:glycoside hydrolase family 32 protein [Phycisphaeraceae bacterium]